MGGGTSIIEATKCGFRTVGVDIDPVAWFITKNKLEESIKSFYKTDLENGEFAEVIYHFWVDVIKCSDCNSTFEGHPHFKLYESHKKQYQVVFCPDCQESVMGRLGRVTV